MSRDLPAKPSLEFLRKQAKQLQRTMPLGKLADAQHALAREYGFADWARLKSYVATRGMEPAEALRVAVWDSDAQRVQELLGSHPELRATIDQPLPDYGFGQHALFAGVQRSDRKTIDALLRAGADIRKRTEWWAGGFGVLDDCDPGLVDFLIRLCAKSRSNLPILRITCRDLLHVGAYSNHRRPRHVSGPRT